MLKVNLKELAIATLWKNLEKKLNTETVKNAIRNNEVEYTYTNYASIKTSASPKKHYMKDGKEIAINTSEIIANYCKENNITIEIEQRPNYAIEIVPSETAISEFNKMLDILATSGNQNIRRTASGVKKTINKTRK